jgi:hypothetical protein
MTDYIIKDNIAPLWKVTLDEDYVGLIDLRCPNRTSYVITKLLQPEYKDRYKFRVRLKKMKKGRYMEFIIPNPKLNPRNNVLVEITEYRKGKFMRSKKMLDITFLNLEEAFIFSRSSG